MVIAHLRRMSFLSTVGDIPMMLLMVVRIIGAIIEESEDAFILRDLLV